MRRLAPALLLVFALTACDSDSPATETPTSSASATATDTLTPSMTSTSSPTSTSPTATSISTLPPPEITSTPTGPVPTDYHDLRATHLQIPTLGIDTDVVLSESVLAGPAPAGCPARAPGATTLT